MPVTVHCHVCGKSIDVFPSGAKRSAYHFCSDKCLSQPSIPVTCTECGKPFLTTVYTRNHAKFCSDDCRHSHNRREEVHKKTPRTALVCERCGKPFLVRRSIGNVQRYCSQKCSASVHGENSRGENNVKWKAKIDVTCDYCGKEFQTYPSRQGRRKYCCKAHAVLGNLKRFASGGRTDIEKAMANALHKNKIAFDEQVVLYEKFMVDFKLTNHPIIIQCDGTYWHDRPKVRSRDKGQDAYLTKAGYVVLRFDDTQLLKDIDSCIRVIKNTIRNPGQPPLINY